MGGCSNVVPVIFELLRKVPSLSSDEPDAILRLVGKLDEIHSLGLVDKLFVIRILPLHSGDVLSFMENVCGMGGVGSIVNLSYCVSFSPISFVRGLSAITLCSTFIKRERGIDYESKVFAASNFLQYEAVEEEMVGRIVMNLHPTVLAHAAFLDRPRSRKDLINAVGLIEESFSVLRERKRTQSNVAMSSGTSVRSLEASRNGPRNRNPSRCWNCGRAGHLRRDCRRQPHSGESGSRPAVGRTPGGDSWCDSEGCGQLSRHVILD